MFVLEFSKWRTNILKRGEEYFTKKKRKIPDPGDVAPLSPLRGSGVMDDEKGMLRLLPLWGLENPLSEGEREPTSLPSTTRLFSGSVGTKPPSTVRFRLPRPSMASSKLCSRSPFPSKDKSVLSAPRWMPGLPPRPFRASRGELWAFGVLGSRGGEGWEGYGELRELREFGVRSCQTGGGVELKKKRDGGLWKFKRHYDWK